MINDKAAQTVYDIQQKLEDALSALEEDGAETLTLQQTKDLFDYLLKTELSGEFIARCVSGKIYEVSQ